MQKEQRLRSCDGKIHKLVISMIERRHSLARRLQGDDDLLEATKQGISNGRSIHARSLNEECRIPRVHVYIIDITERN